MAIFDVTLPLNTPKNAGYSIKAFKVFYLFDASVNFFLKDALGFSMHMIMFLQIKMDLLLF